MAATFVCETCGDQFSLSDSVQERYPNWTPRHCMNCRPSGRSGGTAGAPSGSSATARGKRSNHAAPTSDPQSGVFTDGSCQGNPGPGGWGAVWVEDGQIIAENQGFDPATTNNRMEFTALIAGLEMLPEDATETVYTDSQLAVNTLTKWAAGWAQRGWKRKEGPVANLDLVQQAYSLLQARPGVTIAWVPGHSGFTWNEYVDRLSTAHVGGGQ